MDRQVANDLLMRPLALLGTRQVLPGLPGVKLSPVTLQYSAGWRQDGPLSPLRGK